MGDKADNILSSFGLSEDDQKKFSVVRDKFMNHFVKRRNVILFERAKFNPRKQLQDETVDSFITDLFCLAEHCVYGQLCHELIRDRLVVGLLDASLSEKMRIDPEFTLDKAIALARQSEAMRKQQPVVRGTQQQDCLTVEQEKIDVLSYNNPKNANKFRHADRQDQWRS